MMVTISVWLLLGFGSPVQHLDTSAVVHADVEIHDEKAGGADHASDLGLGADELRGELNHLRLEMAEIEKRERSIGEAISFAASSKASLEKLAVEGIALVPAKPPGSQQELADFCAEFERQYHDIVLPISSANAERENIIESVRELPYLRSYVLASLRELEELDDLGGAISGKLRPLKSISRQCFMEVVDESLTRADVKRITDSFGATLRPFGAAEVAALRTSIRDVIVGRWSTLISKLGELRGKSQADRQALQQRFDESRATAAKLRAAENAKATAATKDAEKSAMSNLYLAVFMMIGALFLLGVGLLVRMKDAKALVERRTIVELVTIGFMLLTVIILGTADKIHNEALSALLGTIAGYIFGKEIGTKNEAAAHAGDSDRQVPNG